MAQTEAIVAAVQPGQLGLPTPCLDYDVRALLSHIVGGLNRAAIIGEGGDALARPARADDVPDDGWLATYRAASQRARQAWSDDAKLDALVEVPWGKIPGRFAIAGYIQEVLTHGWDLAQATGQPTEGDPDLARFALAGAKRVLPPQGRGDPLRPRRFGPVRGRPLRPASRLARPPALTGPGSRHTLDPVALTQPRRATSRWSFAWLNSIDAAQAAELEPSLRLPEPPDLAPYRPARFLAARAPSAGAC
jgi:uncharacterized protein (TIGR03086 family)